MSKKLCPKCDGVRTVWDPKKREYVDCPRCNGTGEVQE